MTNSSKEFDVKLRILFFCVVLCGLACGPARVDTSTDKTMKATLKEAKESLPKDKQKQFDRAVEILTDAEMNLLPDNATEATMMVALKKRANVNEHMKTVLDGKSGEEILTEARRITEKLERRQMERLRTLKKKAQERLDDLAKVEILNCRYYIEKKRYQIARPVLEFFVKNGSSRPVDSITVSAILGTPGRELPWIKDDVKIYVFGGLVQGGQRKCEIRPNAFSGWWDKSIPKNATLTAAIKTVDEIRPPGSPIYVFTEKDENHLKELEAKYGK